MVDICHGVNILKMYIIYKSKPLLSLDVCTVWTIWNYIYCILLSRVVLWVEHLLMLYFIGLFDRVVLIQKEKIKQGLVLQIDWQKMMVQVKIRVYYTAYLKCRTPKTEMTHWGTRPFSVRQWREGERRGGDVIALWSVLPLLV